MGRAASTDRQSRPGVIRRRVDRGLARSHARIALRPHDPGTGEEIGKREIVKGYEYGSRGACRMPHVGYPRLNSSACAVVPDGGVLADLRYLCALAGHDKDSACP